LCEAELQVAKQAAQLVLVSLLELSVLHQSNIYLCFVTYLLSFLK